MRLKSIVQEAYHSAKITVPFVLYLGTMGVIVETVKQIFHPEEYSINLYQQIEDNTIIEEEDRAWITKYKDGSKKILKKTFPYNITYIENTGDNIPDKKLFYGPGFRGMPMAGELKMTVYEKAEVSRIFAKYTPTP